MSRSKSKPSRTRRVLSVVLSVVVAVPLAVMIGWLVDDVAFRQDLPRGVVVAGVDIGGTDRADATVRLERSPLPEQRIELRWAARSLVRSASELGVSVDTLATLDEVSGRGPAAARPFRWLRSLFDEQTTAPVLVVDEAPLRDLFTTGEGSAFGIQFGLPEIGLVDGKFVTRSEATVPQVDVEALDNELIKAALTPAGEREPIEVPSLGRRTIDTADADLAERANALTEGGIGVSLLGTSESFQIPQATLRSWVVFGGTRQNPEITLDPETVLGVLESLFVGLGQSGEQSRFVVDRVDNVRILGGAPGSVCCQPDSAELILAALVTDQRSVRLRPQEDPDAKGVAWAESLGIKELVGEFTTNFKPGQTRVTNIDRIAEITRGALIESGDTFSINEFVGRRTRAMGFVSAGVISNGVFDSSVGGGISQYATTLFNAAFFAGLDFGEYQSHSIYISRYPYGREATMSFPHPDLQIINTTPYGILIWPTTTDRSITVSLYSTKWVVGEQTGQSERREGTACTRVTTERTRTWLDDGRTETDTVTARYRPVGVACNGSSSVPTTTTEPAPTTVPTTPTTVPTTTTATAPVSSTTTTTTTTAPLP